MVLLVSADVQSGANSVHFEQLLDVVDGQALLPYAHRRVKQTGPQPIARKYQLKINSFQTISLCLYLVTARKYKKKLHK